MQNNKNDLNGKLGKQLKENKEKLNLKKQVQ